MVATQDLTLNLETGSLRFACSLRLAQDLQSALHRLIDTFRQGGENPRSPKPAMEFRADDDLFLEVFCNPNIWPNAFAAKVYLTLRTEDVRLSVELPLSQLRQDLETFLGDA